MGEREIYVFLKLSRYKYIILLRHNLPGVGYIILNTQLDELFHACIFTCWAVILKYRIFSEFSKVSSFLLLATLTLIASSTIIAVLSQNKTALQRVWLCTTGGQLILAEVKHLQVGKK